ncbi:hypothetical protein ACROYT_G010630 [Oculina patagonica]
MLLSCPAPKLFVADLFGQWILRIFLRHSLTKALSLSDWGGGAADYCINVLFYRPNVSSASRNKITAGGCARSNWTLSSLLPNTIYEIAIRAENSEGPGLMSPSIFALSGQNPPLEPPTDLIVLRVDSDSVELEWDPVPAQTPKTVDGYWIYAWKGPQIVLVIPPDAIRVQVAVRGVIRGVVTGLEPWTEYNIVVQGYNSGGLGPVSKVVPVMTLDSKNSYYILSLRITSEAYTEDLKDKSSSKFKILKADVTGEISKLYEKHPWFENAALLSFSPGSVQAEVQLEAANPNMSVVLQVVSSIDILGNFSIDQKAMEIRREPDLQNVTLSASHLRLNVSGKFVINCTVIGGPNDLDITWFKADKVIGLSHRTKVETGLRHSRLTVRDVMAEDEGNYTCQAM